MSDDLAGLVDDLKKYLDRRSRQRGDDPEIVHAFDGNGPDATILKVSHLKRSVDAIETLQKTVLGLRAQTTRLMVTDAGSELRDAIEALERIKAEEYARGLADGMLRGASEAAIPVTK